MATISGLSFTVSSTRTRDLSMLPTPKAFNEVMNVKLTSRSRSVTVKAMGGVKFKGTQMREKKLTEMIEKKIMEAQEVCKGDPITDECKVAWDEVEEVSQAKADLRRKLEDQDPLESFCQENPETDECRIYED